MSYSNEELNIKLTDNIEHSALRLEGVIRKALGSYLGTDPEIENIIEANGYMEDYSFNRQHLDEELMHGNNIPFEMDTSLRMAYRHLMQFKFDPELYFHYLIFERAVMSRRHPTHFVLTSSPLNVDYIPKIRKWVELSKELELACIADVIDYLDNNDNDVYKFIEEDKQLLIEDSVIINEKLQMLRTVVKSDSAKAVKAIYLATLIPSLLPYVDNSILKDKLGGAFLDLYKCLEDTQGLIDEITLKCDLNNFGRTFDSKEINLYTGAINSPISADPMK